MSSPRKSVGSVPTNRSGKPQKSRPSPEASFAQPAKDALHKIWLLLIDGAVALIYFAIVGVIAVAIGEVGHLLEPGLNAFGRNAFAMAENALLVIDIASLTIYFIRRAVRDHLEFS